MRDTFVKTLIEMAEEDDNLHLITGDLGFGVLKPFWERFPKQFTNAGIAEQNMTSFAAGMALEGKTVFSVTFIDDGCGIPKGDLQHIFEPFFSTKTSQGGTGLGLSITYNLVRELGGQITVQSEEGKGTRFIVLLPLKMEPKEGTVARPVGG